MKRGIAIAIFACASLAAGAASAQNRGLYPLGMSATGSGIVADPGLSYSNLFIFYSRDNAVGPDGEVTAQKLTLAVESDSLGDVVDRAWFAPQVGFVRFDPAGTEVGEVTLKSVEILEGDAKCVTQ